MKVVLDTSTLVAALLHPDHIPGRIFDAVRRSHQLVVSPAIAAEYAAVLTRPKFARLGTRKERQRAVQELVSRPSCYVVHPRVRLALVAADPDDNRFLEAAAEAQADVIVSSDLHLLALGRLIPPAAPKSVPIMRPADALAFLAAQVPAEEAPAD